MKYNFILIPKVIPQACPCQQDLQKKTTGQKQYFRVHSRPIPTTCKYILGVNKYSHDAGICLVDSHTGNIVVNYSKERFSRIKHDGQDIGSLLEHVLNRLGRKVEDIDLVVQNNHHFAIHPFEERLPWTCAMNYYSKEYLSQYNLLPGIPKIEISHHLAHAWSVFPQLPMAFSSSDGLILVMDGMGDASREWVKNEVHDNNSALYIHDLNDSLSVITSERVVQTSWKDIWEKKCYPKQTKPFETFREAETCYRCERDHVNVLWKRWTRERAPSELYNHSFEEMESVGAVYSRIASHIFGDWNACVCHGCLGKVMGLAAYHQQNEKKHFQNKQIGEWIERLENERLIGGQLPEELWIDWKLLKELPFANQWNEENEELFCFYAALAQRIQQDTETIVLPLIQRLAKTEKVSWLGLCGGVFLNSTLNGKILEQSDFPHIWIPPYPGDEGIAIGCALYGYYYCSNQKQTFKQPKRWNAYLGLPYSKQSIEQVVEEYSPWIQQVQPHTFTKHSLAEWVAQQLYNNKVIALFQGASESGPRALGNRSIIANPCHSEMKRKLNKQVKFRESFRPFAPTVLYEKAQDVFEACHESIFDSCLYMSATLLVKDTFQHKIPAVVHEDNTSRVQVLQATDNPFFYQVILAFEKYTNIPLILNTSFNRNAQPIVESPRDALEAFLYPETAIDWLILEDKIIGKRCLCLEDTEFGQKILSLEKNICLHSIENQLGDWIDLQVVDEKGTAHTLQDDIDWWLLQLAFENCHQVDDIIQQFSQQHISRQQTLERIEKWWLWRYLSFSD